MDLFDFLISIFLIQIKTPYIINLHFELVEDDNNVIIDRFPIFLLFIFILFCVNKLWKNHLSFTEESW